MKRIGGQVVWLKLGTFPDITPEQARKAAQRELGGAFGYMDGDRIWQRKKPVWEVIIDKNGKQEAFEATGIRRFESAAVIVKSTREVLIVNADAISSVRRIAWPDRIPYACRWVGWSCPEPN